jgi:hypothetical protein
MVQPEKIGRNDETERDLFLLSVPDILDVPNKLDLPSKYFGVLLACDAQTHEDAAFVNLAGSLMAQGMRYFCSWGNDCERVNDLVDSLIVENYADETVDSVIITMWFADETLDEALWKFLYVAFPANDYEKECHADLAIIIGNSEWTEQAKNRLSDLDDLETRVVGEDDDEDDDAN